MKTLDSRQIVHSIFSMLLFAGYGLLNIILFCASAWAQAPSEYKPQLQKIAYRTKIPSAIQRAAKRVGSTRFFGSFQQAGVTYAAHFYDKSRVRPMRNPEYPGDLERDSCLDIFRLTPAKTWQRILSLPFKRLTRDTRDRLRVEAQSLWVDPAHKTIPLVYFRIMEHADGKGVATGNRTDVYGVLHGQSDANAFFVFNGYIPYSHSTVTLSEISHPDTNGRLTILVIESDPGERSEMAYGWTGQSWKTVGSARFGNDNETFLRWNGTRFVPLQDVAKTP
jgi:hypothetical protein